MRAIQRLRLVLRVVSLCAVALFAFALPQTASAAERVPMCGELGQSIDAPPPIYPGTGEVLAGSPCELHRHTVSIDDLSPPPRDMTPPAAPDLKVALSAPQSLPRVRSTRQEIAPACTQERRPGFVRELERPPR
jgi:hypothetical protein